MKRQYRIWSTLIFFLSFANLFSQNFNKKKADAQLWNESNELLNTGQYEKLIFLNKNLIDLCTRNDYAAGTAMGYYNIGSALCLMNEYKESLLYLKRAEAENKKNNDKNSREIECLIYVIYGNNYLQMELYSVALKYYQKTARFAQYIPRKKRQYYLIDFSYNNIAQIYELTQQKDSAYHYRSKAYQKLKNPLNTLLLANYFIDYKENADSSKYYLQEATGKWGSQPDNYLHENYMLNEYWGKYYEKKGEYLKSVEYYKKSLSISFEINISSYTMDAYDHLYKVSAKNNSPEEANNYLLKYTQIKDSINSQQKKSLDFSIRKFLNEKDDEYKSKERKLIYIVIIISVIILILLLIFFYSYRGKKEKKKHQEKVEDREYQNRVKDNFEEVASLARKNNPEFITRFIELYPEFYQALLKIYPDINTETLKFCALLKLNFSTKDIAEYTFITPRAIQMRKNRLRKKLNISSKEDLYLWINKLS
ncbi:tetratricopeptide (TPR) repeat protein [Chryseobacterium defluvii]|uniref:Tetratricopeptide (TPR) repeat protein n=1 Tax=Chryseobacterium defluvii TaxID=160396 RepID=A0A840K7M1_9FLAO|nr:hypothetical protein [Chryseobacterium defluvii]MBB4805511.1 tetratricopeptide (TPR) repeat protein [Chryseobacterium defluvii]